ncbi:MAG: lamin tail domain-containing protein [Propionibacteriales bacterium]|nr:lamin tail domain-containing protein [Propionibacteriales bacterium]
MISAKTFAASLSLAAALAAMPLAPVDAGNARLAASGPFRIDKIHYRQGVTLNSEYIVIKNVTARRHRLTGFRVVDRQDGQRYRFPRTILGAGHSVVLHTGHGQNNPGDRYWNRDAPVWNNDGDTALLKNRSAVVVDRCSYPGGDTTAYC